MMVGNDRVLGSPISWHDPVEVLKLPIAVMWAKPFRERIARLRTEHRIIYEAIRATIDAVTRKMRSAGWQRRYTSNRKRDGRADSRYYYHPDMRPRREVRISSHPHPSPTSYFGIQFIITRDSLTLPAINNLLRKIAALVLPKPTTRIRTKA